MFAWNVIGARRIIQNKQKTIVQAFSECMGTKPSFETRAKMITEDDIRVAKKVFKSKK